MKGIVYDIYSTEPHPDEKQHLLKELCNLFNRSYKNFERSKRPIFSLKQLKQYREILGHGQEGTINRYD